MRMIFLNVQIASALSSNKRRLAVGETILKKALRRLLNIPLEPSFCSCDIPGLEASMPIILNKDCPNCKTRYEAYIKEKLKLKEAGGG